MFTCFNYNQLLSILPFKKKTRIEDGENEYENISKQSANVLSESDEKKDRASNAIFIAIAFSFSLTIVEKAAFVVRERKRIVTLLVFFSFSFFFLFFFLSPVNGEICKEWKEEKWRDKDNNTVKHFLLFLKQMSVDVRGKDSKKKKSDIRTRKSK